MEKLIFFVSGRDFTSGLQLRPGVEPVIAIREIEALLDAYNVQSKRIIHPFFRILESCVPSVEPGLFHSFRQAVFIHYIGTKDFVYESASTVLDEAVEEFLVAAKKDVALAERIKDMKARGASFSVDRVSHAVPITSRLESRVKRQLGAYVKGLSGLRVDLERADLKVHLIITRPDNDARTLVFLVSLNGYYHEKKGYDDRIAGKRPSYDIGTMNPPLSSFMVTMVQPGPGSTRMLIDLFCGTGGILIEAHARGIPVLGMDIRPTSVRGARQNLLHYGRGHRSGMHLLVGSVFHPPLRAELPAYQNIAMACTDPPYGKMESMRRQAPGRYVDVLFSLSPWCERYCFAFPSGYHEMTEEIIKRVSPGASIRYLDYFEHVSFKRRVYIVVPRGNEQG